MMLARRGGRALVAAAIALTVLGVFAMPTGHEDWGQSAATATVSPVADLGELAARLGSIDVYSRSGNVFYLDSFESGLAGWQQQLSGIGAAIALDGTVAYSPPVSVRMTGGSDASAFALLTRIMPVVQLARLGAELSFSMPTAHEHISLSVAQTDGANLFRFRIRIDATASQLRVLAADGSDTVFATPTIETGDERVWHTAKLVVDVANLRYTRFYLDSSSYVLSAFTPFSSALVLFPQLELQLGVVSRAGQNDQMVLDDVILTINEP